MRQSLILKCRRLCLITNHKNYHRYTHFHNAPHNFLLKRYLLKNVLFESKQNIFNLTSVEKPIHPAWFIHIPLPMSNGAFKSLKLKLAFWSQLS